MALALPTATPPIIPPQNSVPLNPPILGAVFPRTQVPGTVQMVAVPPSVARQNAKKQGANNQKRKDGTALRQAVTKISGNVPPPPPPISQEQASKETVPQYTPAQYEAPKMNGLRYLAAGLSILFPGAPIGTLASSFLGGQNQAAKNRYQRQEEQAKQQYQVAKDQADIAYQNQAAQQKAIYDNAVLQFQQRQDMVQRGIDWRTGKPMPFPAIQTLLPTVKDPKTGAISRDSSYQGYAQAYSTLAQRAEQAGATDIATQYATQAQEYNKLAIDEANNEKALAIASARLQESSQYHAAEIGLRSSELNLQANRLAFDEARATASDTNKVFALRTKAQTDYNEWAKSWIAMTRPQTTKDALGNIHVTGPSQLNPQQQQQLGKIFSQIDASQNPYDLAQYYASFAPSQKVKDLLTNRGEWQETVHRSQGRAILPLTLPSKPSAKEMVELNTDLGIKGQAVPDTPGYTFTGEMEGDTYVVQDANGNRTGWKNPH